jgi:hypothetical protein
MAAANGHEVAAKSRDEFAETMSQQDISKAHYMAREWMAAHQW